MLARLAALTAFSAARERALALRPVSDRDEAVLRQRETAEAVHLDAIGVDVPLGGAHDVRERARNAAVGKALATSDLLDVADTSRAAQRVQRVLSRVSADAPLLAVAAAGIADLAPLRDLIEQSINERGEVIDSASAELKTIRRDAAREHDRLKQRMESLIGSPQIRAALQDPIVTLRDGRYVLPVRSEARGAVPGVIHDTSASGATIYVEPMAVVDLGNRWRELQLQERREVERILRDLSAAAGEAADDLVDAVERLAHIDLALAKARLAKQLDARALAKTAPGPPWLVEAPAELRLVDARHPLLEGEVVPVTVVAGGEYRALLITGPNTGGKTVALKTSGLLCAMALAGLPVPAAEGTRIPVYDAIFADIGDEQSIEQSLSTFSGHMTAIIDVIERADERSLVLLDELGAGTDPTEGAALGIAIVDALAAAGATLIATTHHSELKLYAHGADAVMNASVEFDVETLSPTYRLTIGLPGQSNALAIAARLGMPATVTEAARRTLSSEQRDVESVLGELRGQLDAAERRATAAARARDEAQALRADLEARLDELAGESTRLREEARERVRREVRDAERLLQRARQSVESARLEQAAADVERARAAAAELAPPPQPVAPPVKIERQREIAPGNAVWLRGVGSPGEVLSAPDESGEFDVQLGALRTRVRLQQVERTEAPALGAAARTEAPPPPADVPAQVEVRGQTVEEAVPTVERYLDQAARSGRGRVLVIHGRGTGTLRRAVRDLLQRHPLVREFETADGSEGGEGATVVHLVSAR